MGGRPCSGIALVLVLWVIVMLTVMAASFSLNMRREIDLVRNARERVLAGSVADAGIYYTMLRLIDTNNEKKWRTDGSVYEFLFAGARIRVSIYDEAGKFNPNNIAEPVLIRLLQRLDLADEDTGLADVILDWIDPDEFRRPHGAEVDQYREAGLNYGPRNQPFQTIQELQLVLGVSGEVYRKLESILTIYNGSPGIDPSVAPVEVLRALPDVTEEVIDIYVEERAANAINNLPPQQFPVAVPEFQFVPAEGTTFRVHSEALLPDGQRAGVAAIIKKASNTGTPFLLLEWKKKFPGEGSLFGESVVVVNQTDTDQFPGKR